MTEPENLVLREIRALLDELHTRVDGVTQTLSGILMRLTSIEQLLVAWLEKTKHD